MALEDFTYLVNRSLGGITDPNDPRVLAGLDAIRQYDPLANLRPVYGSEGNLTGYSVDYDASKLPGVDGTGSLGGISGHGTGGDFMPRFSTVQDQMVLKDPSATQQSGVYGNVTDNTNIENPMTTLDWLGPLLVAGFGLGMGGMPGIYEGVFGQGAFGGGGAAAGGAAAATDPFLAGGTGAMDMTGSAGTGLAGSTGAAGAATAAGGTAAAGGGAGAAGGVSGAAGGLTGIPGLDSILGSLPKGIAPLVGAILSGAGGIFAKNTADHATDAALSRLGDTESKVTNLLSGGAAGYAPYAALGQQGVAGLGAMGPSPIAQNFQPLGVGRGIVGGPGAPQRAPTTLGALTYRGR